MPSAPRGAGRCRLPAEPVQVQRPDLLVSGPSLPLRGTPVGAAGDSVAVAEHLKFSLCPIPSHPSLLTSVLSKSLTHRFLYRSWIPRDSDCRLTPCKLPWSTSINMQNPFVCSSGFSSLLKDLYFQIPTVQPLLGYLASSSQLSCLQIKFCLFYLLICLLPLNIFK